ncbi:tagatose-6-phosphate kinase [Loigolactobacillus rennini]|nr:tagatose-6-phosphate kinase [Loigolactobacillus rennini]SFZ88521.1 Tagatose-6-phosphate kinase / 1-phosphofructokinase [Loigolactobacillus rennini]
MILTVTMNPSIDMSYPLKHLAIDTVNRVKEVHKTAGGKGLNVSRVISLMGRDLLATGILGGHFGAYIEARLDDDQIKHDFSHIDQESRNSIAILHDGGNQTEILEAGPTLTSTDATNFLKHYQKLLTQVSLVTMSGSLPGGLEPDFYAKMIQLAHQAGVAVLLDTSGASLKAALESDAKPNLIKPNEAEISQLLGQQVDGHDLASLKQALQAPIFTGVDWIVVSLGAAGAVAKHGDHYYQATIPKIKVVSPVGSGDSTLAGLAMALEAKKPDQQVLQTGMTTGMLNTMEAPTGFINPNLFDQYFAKVNVQAI